MAMVPHERSLVQRLQSKPFALIGVNLDKTSDELKKVQKEKQITWRSFFDGQSGPIARAWGVDGIPEIYVIDAKGVIRYRGVRGEEMDKAVDQLLREMEERA
jgi:AhpC/TSA family